MKIKFSKKGGIPVEVFNKMFIQEDKKDKENKEKQRDD